MLENPATPAPAAAPGNDANVITTPSAPVTPASEGKVTIDLKEYRDLQRAKARTLSFERRAEISKGKQAPGQPANGSGIDDAEIAEQIRAAEAGRTAAERKAMQLEVRGKVRDLLDKEEFKVLPKSTRDLILEKPHMLSEADNAEEALLDIEDFVRLKITEIGSSQPGGTGQGGVGSRPANPPAHETPPVGGGDPAPTKPDGLEDTSKLKGSEKTRAILRNQLKTAKGVK